MEQCDTCNMRYICDGEYEFNCKQSGYGGYNEDTRDYQKQVSVSESENINHLKDELEDLQSIENYVAVEMYKQFMKDDIKGFSLVRKQILKKQDVDYFKK